jgi:hypothetical protein
MSTLQNRQFECVAFATVLYKVITGGSVANLLSGIIEKAMSGF